MFAEPRSLVQVSSNRVLRTVALAVGLLAALLALPYDRTGSAPPSASPLVTDSDSLPTINKFRAPLSFQVDGSGDVTFAADSAATFRWDRSSGTRSRILQAFDPMPGFPNSVLNGVGGPIQVNSAGHLAMINNWGAPGQRNPSGVFVYNGAGFLPVVLRGDLAQGTPGLKFEAFGTVFINSSDKVFLIATLEPVGSPGLGIFLGSTTGPPDKIAINGEPAPGTGGGTFANFFPFGVNSAGETLFGANITGGSTDFGYFKATPPPVSIIKIAANGDLAPSGGGGTFVLQPFVGLSGLSDTGNVAFQATIMGGAPVTSGIWVGNSFGTLNKLLVNGDASSIGGTYAQPALRDFNNADQVLYSSNLSAAPGHALFIKDLSNPEQVVFKRGDPVPGGTTETFLTTLPCSLNDSGKVAVLAQLTGGPVTLGLFAGSGTSAPVKVAFNLEATPAGGTFGFAGSLQLPRINGSGQIAFICDMLGPNAIGLFLYDPVDGVLPVVSTDDTLPPGGNLAVRTFVPAVSNDHLAFGVSTTGGRLSFFSKKLKKGGGQPALLFSEGDTAPGIGGTFWGNPSFAQMNDNEEFVFGTGRTVGGTPYPASIIFTHHPSFGLRKVAATGDPAPGGGTFNSFDITDLSRPGGVITASGNVAFLGGVSGSPGSTSGIFIGPAGGAISKVVRHGDASPLAAGATFTPFNLNLTDLSVNASGDIAFRTTSQVGPLQVDAIFVASASSAPVKVVAEGDIGPGGGTFTVLPSQVQINNSGQVSYVAGLSGPVTEAVMRGTAGGPQTAIAQTGGSAPGTGTGFFSDFEPADIDMNNSGTIAFWAAISGSPGITTGYFAGSGGPLANKLLEGQALPGGGTSGLVASFPGSFRAQGFTLADDGRLEMAVSNIVGASNLARLVIAAPNGTLSKLATTGEKAQGTGSDFGSISQIVLVNSSSEFVFTSLLVNGTAKFGIFSEK